MANDPLLANAVTALYDTALDATAWPQALAALARAFDSPMATLWQYDRATGQVQDLLAHGLPESVTRRYAQHFVTLDPATPVVLASAPGTWLGDEQLLDARSASHQPYWVDFALPSNIGRVGGGQVWVQDTRCLYFGVQRPVGGPRFGPDAARLFQWLAPHLARAAAIGQRVQRLGQGATLAQGLVDSWPLPAAVLDAQLRPQLLNAAAIRDWRAPAPLRLGGRQLAAAEATQQAWLNQAVQQACGHPAQASARLMPAATPPAWQVLVLPLHGSTAAAQTLRTGPSHPLALLMAADPHRAGLSAPLMRGLFGLTDAEARVLQGLCQGHSAVELARQRGLRITTIRTHVQALLAKLGVDSQARLVALARALPGLCDKNPDLPEAREGPTPD